MMLMVFWVCVIVSSFTLFNMLLGILCEVCDATRQIEQAKNEEEIASEIILGFFEAMDDDKSGTINFKEYLSMASNPEVMKSLEKIGISRPKFEQYALLLFNPNDKKNMVAELPYR